MTLAVNNYVWGKVTDGGTPVNGALVHARDSTEGQGDGDYTTGADGKYQINLKDIANDGHTILVWA